MSERHRTPNRGQWGKDIFSLSASFVISFVVSLRFHRRTSFGCFFFPGSLTFYFFYPTGQRFKTRRPVGLLMRGLQVSGAHTYYTAPNQPQLNFPLVLPASKE